MAKLIKVYGGCAILCGLSIIAGKLDLRIHPSLAAPIILGTPVIVMWILYLIKDNDLYQ